MTPPSPYLEQPVRCERAAIWDRARQIWRAHPAWTTRRALISALNEFGRGEMDLPWLVDRKDPDQ